MSLCILVRAKVTLKGRGSYRMISAFLAPCGTGPVAPALHWARVCALDPDWAGVLTPLSDLPGQPLVCGLKVTSCLCAGSSKQHARFFQTGSRFACSQPRCPGAAPRQPCARLCALSFAYSLDFLFHVSSSYLSRDDKPFKGRDPISFLFCLPHNLKLAHGRPNAWEFPPPTLRA